MISRPVYELLKSVIETNLLVPENPDKNLEVFLKIELSQYNVHGADSLVHDTMKLAWEIFEQCQSANATIERLENSLASHGIDWNMLGQELSLDEMRQIGENFVQTAREMNRGGKFNLPEVPFGHKNDNWEWMLREYQDGDKFFYYSSVESKSDRNPPHRNGYCMVRGNKIMVTLTTMRV